MSAAVQTLAASRTFYSKSAHLNFYVGKVRRIESDGQKTLDDGVQVQFTPIGDGWGQFTTDEPALIAACEKRGDVFSPEVYNRESTPIEMRAEAAESKAARLERELEEKNRLIASFQKKP